MYVACLCVTVDGGEGVELFSNISSLRFGIVYIYVCIYTRARAYLQLSISIWQSCRSIGKYCRFIGHDAVIVKLQQTQKDYSQSTKRDKRERRWTFLFKLQKSTCCTKNSRKKKKKDQRFTSKCRPVVSSFSRFLVESAPSLSSFGRQCNIKQRKGARVRES